MLYLMYNGKKKEERMRIFIVLLSSLFYLTYSHQATAQFAIEAEGSSRLTINQDIEPLLWGWGSWQSKKNVGVYVYGGVAKEWQAIIAGAFWGTYYDTWGVEFGVGAGVERHENPYYINGYLSAYKDKFVLDLYFEYGAIGPWWENEFVYQAHDVIGIGLRNRYHFLGPSVTFGNDRISYFMCLGYNFSDSSGGLMVGGYVYIGPKE
jgi:hypothetical protein